MSRPRAFISFEMEDSWARDVLVQHARQEGNDVEFHDYSVKEAFESKWKTECTKQIALTKGTIVLVGSTTYLSEAVAWEIAETLRQRHEIFGVQIDRERTFNIPAGLDEESVIRWEFSQVAERLAAWT